MERTLTDGPFLLVDCLSVAISKGTSSVESAINGCSTKLPLMVEENSGRQQEGKRVTLPPASSFFNLAVQACQWVMVDIRPFTFSLFLGPGNKTLHS